MGLVSELRRRNVIRVAIAYGVVTWLLIEVSATTFPMLRLPEWTATFVAVLLMIGFPVALIFAWAYELTPDGMKRTSEPAVESPSSVIEEQARGVLPNSVAVLPLANLSPNPDDAYFAAGLHEEILSQLSKLRSLNVIARTSVLPYADAGKGISEIAAELNVETVMEGSVRFADNRIRVTMQLINSETGLHLWSETYDREFEDIFAIESDIAMNVANALEAEFSHVEQARIERVPTDSPEAYAFFLRATNAQTPVERRQYFGSAIEADCKFAEAYAWRAYFDGLALTNTGVVLAENPTPQSQVALANSVLHDVDHALMLNPNLGLAYFSRAMLHTFHWRWSKAGPDIDRAINLSPNDIGVLANLAGLLTFLGREEEAIIRGQRAVELNPKDLLSHAGLGLAYLTAGRPDAAAQSFRKTVYLQANYLLGIEFLGYSEVVLGNFAEAREALRLTAMLEDSPSAWSAFRAYSYSIMGDDQEASRLFTQFETWAANVDRVGAGDWAAAYLAVGDNEQALAWLNRALERIEAQEPDLSMLVLLRLKQNVFSDPVLEEPEFAAVRKRIRGK